MAELRPLFELIAVASLCGWAACLMFGFSLFSPVKSMLVGAAGIVVGWAAWQSLGLPFGLSFSGFPVLPSLSGTLLTAFAAQILGQLFDGVAGEASRRPLVLTDPPATPASEPPQAPEPDEAPVPPAARQSGE